jgi:16S rRNA processing protein RimM
LSNNPRKGRHCEDSLEQEVIIGKVVSVNIPRRELRIAPETSHPERFHGLKEILLKAEGGRIIRLVLGGMRAAGSAFVAKVETDDDNVLASIRKASVIVSREDRFRLPENEYYIDDIVGLVVKDEGGKIIGRLSEVLETPANDIYQVIDDEGRETLLPAIEDVILHVDIEGGEMKVDISGLE